MNDPAAYGDACAEFYDEIYPPPSPAALRRLTQLAAGGAVLDAGCGTGRYLLALVARGLAVHGIEASPAMIAQLRAKPGGRDIGLTCGDFSRIDAPGEYALVVCLTDTLALLLDPDAQACAMQRLARRLVTDGALVIETSVTDRATADTDVMLQTRFGARRYAVDLSPVSLDDLDAWAAQAGLVLASRWRDWNSNAWEGGAGQVLSCYRRHPER